MPKFIVKLFVPLWGTPGQVADRRGEGLCLVFPVVKKRGAGAPLDILCFTDCITAEIAVQNNFYRDLLI